MPSYVRWIRIAKEALHKGDKEKAADVKRRLSHTPELWESILLEFENEKKANKSKKPPAKKTQPKTRAKKVKNEK
tara:strand:- start:154 stop:378 length:225 start_codon:yes stop_codon:yes gene_type:complete